MIIFEAKQINFIRKKSGSAAFLEILSLKPSLTIEITQNKTKKRNVRRLLVRVKAHRRVLMMGTASKTCINDG